jgi:hypothetical protein
MTTAITTLLALISAILGELGVGSSTVVEKIIASLIGLVPIIAQGASELAAPVQNIIQALQTSGNATPAQMTALSNLDTEVDAAFEAAAAAAGAPADPTAVTPVTGS